MAHPRPLLLLPALLSLVLLPPAAPTSSPPWSGPHIADLSVLLPPRMSSPVQYRLVGSGGCFSWSWDHHDILSVVPEYNGSVACSTSARLISIAPYSGRKETAVYATDVGTGAVIRCEVFIDKIARIRIFHHSIKLDLHGLTELRIRGFDDNDNIFSSLVGLRFKWLLIPVAMDNDNARNHLVHVPLMETPLSDCGGFCGDLETQIKLEDNDAGSDLYVVKGLEIGHETVTAQLLEPQSEHVVDKIVLTVAEMMSLYPPSPVFVIVDALVPYKLNVIRKSVPKEIDLPSPFHRWSVSNTSVATVDLLMGTVAATHLGVTNIIVEDIRVSGHKQISSMSVVVPERLCLYVIPATKSFNPLVEAHGCPFVDVWYIVTGQEYIVYLKALSPKPEEKEIYLTQNNVLELESDNYEYWTLALIDGHNEYGGPSPRLLRPHAQGQGTIAATLAFRRGIEEMIEVLQTEQQVVVCNVISIHIREGDVVKEVIHLPWAPGFHQELELMATGGCAKMEKDYRWYSSDEGIASVSASGIVRAEHPGQAALKVVSVYDMLNYAEVMIEVSIPFSMVMLPYFPVETTVGDDLHAAVALNPSNGTYYHRCDTFSSSIIWRVFSERECFEVVNLSSYPSLEIPSTFDESGIFYGSPCAWACIKTICSGRASLHSAFSSDILPNSHFSSDKIVLQASKLIASYDALHARQAGDGNQYGGYRVNVGKVGSDVHGTSINFSELYLAPGTAMDVIVLGGPERWGQGVEFFDSFNISRINESKWVQNEVHLKLTPVDGRRLYTILCRTVGDYKLVFSQGNLAGPNHFLPAIETLELSLSCSFPAMISLIINQIANTHEVIQSSVQELRVPGNTHLSPISVANGQTIRIAAVGIHASGRPFANSSSLSLKWELNGCEDLAYWKGGINSGRSVIEWEKFLVLRNATGQCVVRATVVGLSDIGAGLLYKKAHKLLESTAIGVNDAVKLQLVSSLNIVPETAILFFDPEAKINMTVIGGTCFLEASLNDTNVARILPLPGVAQCTWLTLVPRQVGSSLLTVYDKGLSPPASAVAAVHVSTVDWIKVLPDEEVFMPEGSTKHFDILAGTEDGKIFDISQYSYMNIHLHIDDNILKVVDNGSISVAAKRLHHPSFEIFAANIGVASLHVSLRGHSGNLITSKLVLVEVYSALKVHPDYLFLAPGAAYTIVADGGPTTPSFVEFSSLDPEIAVVNQFTGLLSAVSIGNTTVRAVSYGNDGSLICEAFGRIEIGIPPMMILSMQSEQFCIGCQMPLYPSYPEGNLFAFYDVCKDYMWSIGDEKVLSFESLKSLDNKVPLHSIGQAETTSHDSDNEDFGFINVVNGRSAGVTNVSVSFSCDFVSSGIHFMTNYVASRLVRVVPDPPLALGIPITWVLPPHYTSTDVLPDFSEFQGQQESRLRKKNVVYHVLKFCELNDQSHRDPIIIDGTKVRTRESNSLTCIQAKDQTGRSEIACCIRVAEVFQVKISTKELPSFVLHLAVNDHFDVVADFYDSLGYPFLEAHGVVPLGSEINYPDVVSIHMYSKNEYQNFSKEHFHLQALQHGKALVKIFFKQNPQKATYILVLVGAQLFPQNPDLRVGNFVNFSIVGGSDGGQGKWLSSNDSVISVDGLTGLAHACAVGNAKVHFESSSMKLTTTVTVLEDEHILVHAPVGTLTNVHLQSEGYMFPVDLSHGLFNKDNYAKADDINNLFDCLLDPPFIGHAKPWRDYTTGVFYCLFFPYSPAHLVDLASKLNPSRGLLAGSGNGFIYLSVTASLRGAQSIMNTARASFIGGFSVSAERLHLTSELNRSHIVLKGNTDVEINWNHKDHLTVIQILKKDFGVGSCAEYEVRVLQRRAFNDKITIALPAIGQSIELDVTYDPGDQGVLTDSTSTTWSALVASMLMLVWTAIVAIRFISKPELPPVVEQPIAPRQLSTAFDSPLHPPPSPDHSPQPLVEYVRRTIDETPYYRRAGRRLFDPRNSY